MHTSTRACTVFYFLWCNVQVSSVQFSIVRAKYTETHTGSRATTRVCKFGLGSKIRPVTLVALVALLMPKGTTGATKTERKAGEEAMLLPISVLHERFSGDAPQNQGLFVQQDAAPSVADHGADQFADLRFSIYL